MADDLKPMLTKVLASEGKKRFFFAYAPGKRKDGNGEGALIVRGKKPKKTEIEGELADCKELYEGTCWVGNGPENGATVYFQTRGKKLSPALMPKMMLCAKKQIGRQYDFQIPSEEEEARADKLGEGDDAAGDQPEASAAPTAPAPSAAPAPPPARSAELQGRLKTLLTRQKELLASSPGLKEKLLPLSQAAADRVLKGGGDAAQALDALEAALAAPPAGGAATAEAGYADRVKAMSDRLKQAIASGTPSGAEVKRLFSESQLAFRKQDMARANALLDAADEQIRAVAAPPTGMAAFNERAKAAKAAIDRAAETDPGRVSDLKKRLAQAAASAMAKQFDAALATLDTILADAEAPSVKNPVLDRWNVARGEVVAALQDVIAMVRTTGHPMVTGAEVELKAVVAQLNGELATRQQAAEMERYLQQDDVVDDVCDLAYDLKTPLLTTLSEIMPQLAS